MKKLFLGLVAIFALSTIGFAQTECASKASAKTADNNEVKFVKASNKKGGDIVDTAVGAGIFKTLVAAVQAAGLVDTLKGEGPFTVFAPTDEAFAKLPAGTVENLLKPENKDMLVKILTYHVVSGKVMAADVVKLKSAKTVQGQLIKIKVKKGKVMLNKTTNVIKTDIGTSNGVVHVIDSVLMPK
jgi:transforming growth factor-beta-induced protein